MANIDFQEEIDFQPEGGGGESSVRPAFSMKKLGKEAIGMVGGLADAAAGAAAFPISGLVGLGVGAVNGPEAGAAAVQKTQEELSPTAALEKVGVPKEFLSGTDTHAAIMKIMEAPHEYISKPIADKYHELTGNSLTAAIMQGTLDVLAYGASFGLLKRGAGASVRKPSAEAIDAKRAELGYKNEPIDFREINTNDYKQLDLPLVDREQPSSLRQREWAAEQDRLEREAAQGEVVSDTESQAFLNRQLSNTPDMFTKGDPLEVFTEERKPSSREHDVAQRELNLEVPEQQFKDVNLEHNPALDQMYGKMENQRPLEFRNEAVSDFGTVGEERARRLQEQQREREANRPIEYTREDRLRIARAKGQAGAVDPTAMKEGVEKVTTLITKPIRDFHKNLGERVRERAEELIKKVEEYPDWKWDEGDRLKSNKTGTVYKVLGRSWSDGNKYGGPRYKVESLDGKTKQEFMAEKAHEEGQFTLLSGPQRNPFKGPGGKQAGALNIFGKDPNKEIAKKGVAGTLLDYKQQFGGKFNGMKLPDLVEKEGITPENIKDLATDNPKYTMDRLKKMWNTGMSNFLIDKTMAILSADKGPVGKLVQWAVDNRRNIDRLKDMKINERVHAALRPWKALKKASIKELSDMKKVWFDNIGADRQLTRQDFKTDRQWEVFKGIQDVIKDGFDRVNEARESIGLQPIKYINNYFHAMREGDYWVYIKDNKGETKWAQAFNTIGKANEAHAKLKKEYGSEFEVQEPIVRGRSQYELEHGFQAFEETLRVLEKNDPVTQAIQARYAELRGKRGHGVTAIHRKGIPGALGFEEGKVGVRNAEKVLESYIKQQEQYIANIQKGELSKQLVELEKPIRDKIPMALNYLKDYLDASRGADLDKAPIIRDIVESMSTAAGLNKGAPRQFMKDTAAFASLLWLVKPKFAISQLVQPLNIMAKLLEMRGADSMIKNPAMSMMQGYQNWFSSAKENKAPIEWARKNGYMESTIVSLLDMKLGDLRGERFGIIADAARFSLGKLEQTMVRGPAFMAFEYALRDSIKNPEQRYHTAAELMDYYMVHYDRQSSPLMYNKAGLIGEAARPLKQYSHNTFGQFFEYVNTLKDHKTATPLAGFMATQALVGGLKGMILVAEANAIIAMINAGFNQDFPDVTALLFKSRVPDTLIYGGLSTSLGVDISSSVSAPAIPSMFSFPGIEFGGSVIKDTFNYLYKRAIGEATDQDSMKMAKSLSPQAMHGWIDELYTKPGGPVPNPNDRMRGNYRRSDEPFTGGAFGSVMEAPFSERQMSKWTGMKSIPEAKANDMVRATKALIARDMQQRMSALDAMADRIRNQQPIDAELMQRYIKEGGNPGDLPTALKGRIKGEALTWPERQMGKTPSNAQVNKLNRMKEIMDQHNDALIQEYTKKPEIPPGFEKMSVGIDNQNLDKESAIRIMNKLTALPTEKKQDLLDNPKYESWRNRIRAAIKRDEIQTPSKVFDVNKLEDSGYGTKDRGKLFIVNPKDREDQLRERQVDI